MVRTVQELSAEEKLRLICGKDFWHTDDLGGKIPQITVSDGPSGLRIVKERAEDGSETAYPAAAYPAISLLANTWNRAAAAEMGECLADECLEKGVDVLLAPGVNIKRHPLNGRNFEYFSEDPVLAGEMAKAYIGGLQGGGVGACLKHFCCNNLEYDRLNQSSEVDERTLRELYYLPFEIPANTYKGQEKPVKAMASWNVLITNDKLDEETAYQMTKALYEKKEDILNRKVCISHEDICKVFVNHFSRYDNFHLIIRQIVIRQRESFILLDCEHLTYTTPNRLDKTYIRHSLNKKFIPVIRLRSILNDNLFNTLWNK